MSVISDIDDPIKITEIPAGKRAVLRNTFSHKVQRISEIMTHFQDRRFILIGNSGERDPEVYAEIRKRYPTQEQEIRIRDVGHGGARLEGTTVIPAE